VKRLVLVVVLGVVVAVASFAQPAVSALQNNYSYILPGLPNYGIAQGSIFVMYGSNMGPAQITSAGSPLSATLGGVTINITGSDGKAYQAYPYYVSASQIAGILPSAVPVGNATIKVTYNGQTSAAATVKVVETAFGILTLNGAGSGAAAAFDVHYNYLGATNAANPGESVILWGTGLGPSPDSDTAITTTPTNLGSTVPITVWVGGVQATVQYHGRSGYPGLDQVNVIVPSGVSGCSVSVVVQGGTIVSNFATIPVTASGRTCSDPTLNGISPTQLQTLLAKGTVNFGYLSLGKTTTTTPSITVGTVTVPGSTTTSDNAGADFFQYTAAQYAALFGGEGSTVSIGGCTLYTYTSGSPVSTVNLTVKYLDAGSVINLGLPSGGTDPIPRMEETAGGVNLISYDISSCSQTGQTGCVASIIPTSGGKFTFSNGSGGADIGSFNQSLTVSPNLVWTNMATTGPNISASNPPTLTWTGGDPNGYITITGSSVDYSSTTNYVAASFTCTVADTALKFTIPQWVLLALPVSTSPGGLSGFPGGSLSMGAYGQPQTFTAPGVDIGYAIWDMSAGISVNYTN
jgi:uncharacterized protein (TIGR03437 family)